MVAQVQLTYMSGPADGSVRQLALQGSIPEVVFGRESSCSVALPHDPLVSRRHARLYWRENSWWLEDFGSSNGTFVGEFSRAVKVSAPVRVCDGQVFQVGRSRFRFELPDPQSAGMAATGQAIAQ